MTAKDRIINEMRLAYLNYRAFHNDRSFNYPDAMSDVLKVVLRNIDEIVEWETYGIALKPEFKEMIK